MIFTILLANDTNYEYNSVWERNYLSNKFVLLFLIVTL